MVLAAFDVAGQCAVVVMVPFSGVSVTIPSNGHAVALPRPGMFSSGYPRSKTAGASCLHNRARFNGGQILPVGGSVACQIRLASAWPNSDRAPPDARRVPIPTCQL